MSRKQCLADAADMLAYMMRGDRSEFIESLTPDRKENMSPIETDPAALLRALAKIVDPDGKRYITGIRLEGHVKQIPTLTVWEYVKTGQLAELQEVVQDYQLIPAQPQTGERT